MFLHEQALGDSNEENLPFTGQTLAPGGQPSASTSWVEKESKREGREGDDSQATFSQLM